MAGDNRRQQTIGRLNHMCWCARSGTTSLRVDPLQRDADTFEMSPAARKRERTRAVCYLQSALHLKVQPFSVRSLGAPVPSGARMLPSTPMRLSAARASRPMAGGRCGEKGIPTNLA